MQNLLKERLFTLMSHPAVLPMALLGISLFTALLITFLPFPLGFVFLAGLVGLVVMVIGFLYPLLMVTLAMFASLAVAPVAKYMLQDIPLGVVVDGCLAYGLACVLLRVVFLRENFSIPLRNPVLLLFLLLIAYLGIQAFNPEMDSFTGYVSHNRRVFSYVATLVIVIFSMRNHKNVVFFIKSWFFVAFLTGLYGCYQEWFGFLPYEQRWLDIVESGDVKLIFVGGMARKFSFMTDPTSFGILVTSSALFFLALTIHAIKLKRTRFIVLIGILLMILGSAYSGTRTAYAMFFGGLMMYTLLTINQVRTLVVTAIGLGSLMIVVFGPFYGSTTINRIRSTFQGSDDASMNVRDVNRARIQPYIHDHPIGGGIGTAGQDGLKHNPSHPLAGFPPDSGLLEIALEMGWVGLLLNCLFYFALLQTAIHRYYFPRGSDEKALSLGMIVYIFSLVLAQYTQAAIDAIPTGIIFYALVGIVCSPYRLENDDALAGSTVKQGLEKPR